MMAVLAAGIWNVMPAQFWDRMDTIMVEEGEERDASAAGRLHFWRVAMDMAEANPLTGVGLNALQSGIHQLQHGQAAMKARNAPRTASGSACLETLAIQD